MKQYASDSLKRHIFIALLVLLAIFATSATVVFIEKIEYSDSMIGNEQRR